jgi:hypothetical protein
MLLKIRCEHIKAGTEFLETDCMVKISLSLYDLSAVNNDIMKQFFAYMKNERKICSHTYNSYKQLFDVFLSLC